METGDDHILQILSNSPHFGEKIRISSASCCNLTALVSNDVYYSICARGGAGLRGRNRMGGTDPSRESPGQ